MTALGLVFAVAVAVIAISAVLLLLELLGAMTDEGQV
jgi:hypothetical protein